jgi:hypothetical protein
MEMTMKSFLITMLKLFGVVFLRFRTVPRLWCAWLVGVNLACLYFIGHVEGQAVLVITAIAVSGQTLIYQRIGFTRILGVTHYLWVPMFAWMATRIDTIMTDPALAAWLAILFATNMVSLAVDTVDALRFVRGERAPHYSWERQALA